MNEENLPQNKPDIFKESEPKPKTELQPDDWLCILCYKKITSDKERSTYDGKSEFYFTNPNGYSFDVLTFTKADGCREIGKPTSEFTWFPGYSWNYAMCSRCGLHLGWKYKGENSFYGLIKTRLLRGLTLFN